MEGSSEQKSVERMVSQKAMQIMGRPWQRCAALGFLCGVGMTSLFLAALASVGTLGVFISLNQPSSSSSTSAYTSATECNLDPKITQKIFDSTRSEETSIEENASSLYSAWSSLLAGLPFEADDNLRKLGFSGLNIPQAPHLEDCELRLRQNERLDKRNGTANFPPWTSWKGELSTFRAATASESFASFELEAASDGAYPPWISGSDEENYPLTRKVQRDLWLHQHPLDCRDPGVRFLVADWEREPGYGIGAQIAGMTGLFAVALNEKRVLVTGYYNRADHDGCQGSSRSSWSCYFFPETSQECRDRAQELIGSEEAWRQGIVTGKQSYRSREMWSGPTPRIWGSPWSFLQPTTEVNGSLIASHHKMDRRWWRAQVVRYLMRFRSEYTCKLMNVARHSAFGQEAAVMVAKSFPGERSKEITTDQRHDIEDFVWSNRKAWTPQPLLSMHVRMGDKACEMDIVGFEKYMLLADRVRRRFPELNSVWLSTEMQEVIDKSGEYTNWRFFYTSVRRQVRNASMATYEASLGRETSTNYPIVNFLMAADADFFVGALGSTWCYLIDGMRNTGGKVMAGYLSVNKDRFW